MNKIILSKSLFILKSIFQNIQSQQITNIDTEKEKKKRLDFVGIHSLADSDLH